MDEWMNERIVEVQYFPASTTVRVPVRWLRSLRWLRVS
jgi:hypothetical protein